MPMYAGIIHVLLHRLVWGVGNQISCLYCGLGELRACSFDGRDSSELSLEEIIDGEPEYSRWNRRH